MIEHHGCSLNELCVANTTGRLPPSWMTWFSAIIFFIRSIFDLFGIAHRFYIDGGYVKELLGKCRAILDTVPNDYKRGDFSEQFKQKLRSYKNLKRVSNLLLFPLATICKHQAQRLVHNVEKLVDERKLFSLLSEIAVDPTPSVAERIRSLWEQHQYPEAGYTMAILHLHGKGVDKCKEQYLSYLKAVEGTAVQWYWPAFARGMYHFIQETRIDALDAFSEFKHVAETARDDEYLKHSAEFYVGLMYRLGYGVEQDDDKAFDYMKKAATANPPDFFAIIDIALCCRYQIGQNIEGDYESWIKKVFDDHSEPVSNIWKSVVEKQGVKCGTPFRLCPQDSFYIGFCYLSRLAEDPHQEGRGFVESTRDFLLKCPAIPQNCKENKMISAIIADLYDFV